MPEGRVRSKFLAIGFADNTCKIFSLDTENWLHRTCLQTLPATPESVCFLECGNEQLFLYVGLDNGILVRSLVDNIAGLISDAR